jgi:hypothetical protein
MRDVILAIIGAVFASTGFWTLINQLIVNRKKKKSAETQMLMGLGHDRICYLGETYLDRGYISRDEYENLHDYLFLPYQKLGGNGTAAKIMKEVEQLPLKDKED